MHTLPIGASLILQDMRHYQLILQVQALEPPVLDTDAFMLDISGLLAALLGLSAPLPDAWVNTYMLYLNRAEDYAPEDRSAGLELLALECYEAMRLLARGLRDEEPAPAAG